MINKNFIFKISRETFKNCEEHWNILHFGIFYTSMPGFPDSLRLPLDYWDGQMFLSEISNLSLPFFPDMSSGYRAMPVSIIF